MPEIVKTSLYEDANLQAYYRMDSGALTTDSSGNSRTLTNNNTVGESSSGKFGYAADAGTSNSTKYFNIEDNLDIDGGACSMSIWVKLNTEVASGSYYEFLMQSSANNKVYNRIYYTNSGGTYSLHFIRGRIGVVDVDATVNITALGTSVWHHIVYTYDTTNIRGYLDGSSIVTPTAASGNGTNASTTDRFLIGTYKFGDGGAFNLNNALWDDVGIFNKALTDAEVVSLYLTENLLGYWKCNEASWNGTTNEVVDSSGNSKHGVASGNATTTTGGILGRCGTFDGTGDWVTCSQLALAGTNQISVQAWFKAAAGVFDSIKSITSTGEIYVVQGGYPSAGNGRFAINNGTTWYEAPIYNSARLDDGNWHHMIGTYNGATIRLYVDGTEVGTGNARTGNLRTDGPTHIAADASDNIPFPGLVDEVAIWDRVLSPTEVSTLYNSGNGMTIVKNIDKIHGKSIMVSGKLLDKIITTLRTINNTISN